MELFDASGKKYEAFTSEEVDAKIKTATEEAGKAFETEKTRLTQEADTAKATAAKAAADLAAAGDKDANYKQLRDAKDKAEKDAADAKLALDEVVKKAVDGVTQTFSIKYRDDMLTKLAQGDQALKDKLLVHYETTLKSMPATNDVEIAAKIEAAYRLSVNTPKAGLLNSVFNSGAGTGGGNKGSGGGNNGDVSPEVEKWGAEFGLTKDDISKYTAKAKGNYNQSNDKS